jgi:hypothetical protein
MSGPESVLKGRIDARQHIEHDQCTLRRAAPQVQCVYSAVYPALPPRKAATKPEAPRRRNRLIPGVLRLSGAEPAGSDRGGFGGVLRWSRPRYS